MPRPEGLQIVRRDDPGAMEVAIPFVLRDGGRTYRGLRLSLRRIQVETDEVGRFRIGGVERVVEIRVDLDGFELVLPLRVAPAANVAVEPGNAWFDIVAMDRRTEASLAQLVRTALTGWLPDARDLSEPWDAETPESTTSPVARRGASWLTLTAAALLLFGGLAFAGYQGYLSLTTIRSDTAAVTAQRFDFLSPEFGVAVVDGLSPGQQVKPGDVLASVRSEALEAGLALEQAALDELRSSVPGENRGALERAEGRVAALSRRIQALSFISQCTCTVLWVAPSGMAMAPGALLTSLVVSDPADIRIEAAVPPRTALSVRPGQTAEVTLAGDHTSHRAIVESVAFEAAPFPKVGLRTPDAMVAVILKLEDPETPLVPGRPASVVISK